jgi:hypothetical protein
MTRIPAVLHVVWLEEERVPSWLEANLDAWRRHHPSWELRCWHETHLPSDLRRPEALEPLRPPTERASFLRLELLVREGGVVADPRLACVGALDPILDGATILAVRGRFGTVDDALLAAEPGHPLVVQALAELQPLTSWAIDSPDRAAVHLTGVLAGDPRVMFAPRGFLVQDESEQQPGTVAVDRRLADLASARAAALDAEFQLDRLTDDLANERRRLAELHEALALVRSNIAAARGGDANAP